MSLGRRTAEFSTTHPVFTSILMAAVTALLLGLVILPILWPDAFSRLHTVEIDTDPENMLSAEEDVRVFHNEMKRTLSLNDIIVVGVVNETHPNGVFNAETLQNVYELTEYALTLRGEAIGIDEPNEGVVEIDVIAPSTVDNIEQGGLGTVRFEWLMSEPPATDEEALAVRNKAARLPFLNGTLISEDGKALALYLPITSKDLSYRVYQRLEDKIAEFDGDDEYHITGLPVAEDTFGVEMFKQMAISAPMAMAVIFILLFVFFRKLVLIVSPMIIAIVSVICTMGLLIATGNTIHIMSSMIPIFIMPIAVLDSVHILSDFFDRYQKTRDRKKTVCEVMENLFVPMLFTSLTSTAGFASLALTPIPPVQTFGIFVAIGVMTAWFWTIVFVPAYVMFIPERSLENFGLVHKEDEEHKHVVLDFFKRLTYERATAVLTLTLLLVVVAGYGISRIEINDNPTRWFKANHPIRVADRVLNEHFGGTYMAYLAMTAPEESYDPASYLSELEERMKDYAAGVADTTPEMAPLLPEALEYAAAHAAEFSARDAFLESLRSFAESRLEKASSDTEYGWEEIGFFVDEELQRREVFKQPEALRYVADLQAHLQSLGVVGKSNSLTDIVKTVHRELFEGDEGAFRVPDTSNAVAQCLITYESSHRPHDLYHFVTPDYGTTSIWVQLKSGDNRDMSAVTASVEDYISKNPPPFGLDHRWFGLTYINVVWQEKMVAGMLEAFLGSFLVVLLMMIFLFRSGLWGLLSMIPLTVTIGLIYGIIGLIGKDYDMPVAVLSSLTLGLAVDFAIHFLARARALKTPGTTWRKAHDMAFGEPARAILRNVIVIAIGFLPLLAAPLVPYNTVGFLLAAILLVSGGGTLLILPALMRKFESMLFPDTLRAARTSRYLTWMLASLALAMLVALNAYEFLNLSWAGVTGVIAVGLVIGAAGAVVTRVRRVEPAHVEERG